MNLEAKAKVLKYIKDRMEVLDTAYDSGLISEVELRAKLNEFWILAVTFSLDEKELDDIVNALRCIPL